jgi:hypothetical protein
MQHLKSWTRPELIVGIVVLWIASILVTRYQEADCPKVSKMEENNPHFRLNTHYMADIVHTRPSKILSEF